MSKERLEEIKERYEKRKEFTTPLSYVDCKWLIEQAELVNELEKEQKILQGVCESLDESCQLKEARVSSIAKSKANYRKERNKLNLKVSRLEEKNKRYREVLERISIDSAMTYVEAIDLAIEVLERDPDDNS